MSPKLVDSLKFQKKVVMKLLVPYKIPLNTNLNGLNKCLRCVLEYKLLWSRWLDIGTFLFWLYYGPCLNLAP